MKKIKALVLILLLLLSTFVIQVDFTYAGETKESVEQEYNIDDVSTDYADDPMAGRAQGNVDEGFYNTEEPQTYSLRRTMARTVGPVHDSKFNGTTKRIGIDVSSWQGKDIDWNKVKNSGVEFVFVRIGYRGYETGQIKDDPTGINNLKGAKAAGLKVGAYVFSQAINVREAQEEADYIIRKVSEARCALDLPLVMDYEYSGNPGRLRGANLSKSAATSIVNAFCERVQSRGYNPMLYANKSMLQNDLDAANISSRYLIWLAHYTNQTSYQGNYRFWQYSDSGTVDGINGRVDMDVWYDNGSLMGGGFDSSIDINYSTHVQSVGWQNQVKNGVISGTCGKGLRLEAIKINLGNKPCNGDISYSTHVQGVGWQNWVSNGQQAGTTGKSLRLEAIKIKLTGEMAKQYDVYYRVHAENIGWMGWTKNGSPAGTEGYSYRLEAIQIVVVNKGAAAPGSTNDSYRCTKVRYNSHVQNVGWQNVVKDGSVSGSTGKSLRIEAMHIHLDNQKYDGGIQYQSHVQGSGWENCWKQDGQMTGTTGKSLRLEAIRIKLTGEMEKHYDVYYRAHVEGYGWLGWTKNGASSGTEGMSKRLEAVQIVLVNKGGSAPGSTYNSFIKR